MRKLIVVILCLIPLVVTSQTDEELAKKAKKKCKFVVKKIDSTKNFFILKAINKDKEPVVLVVDKASKQLKKKTIEIGKSFKFKTYSYFDIVHPKSILCHSVEGVEIWCYKDKVDLRFTDSMGDVVYLN